MNQQQFEKQYQDQWAEFEALLKALESGKASREKNAGALFDFPASYRRICNHYGLSRTRHYSPAVVERLHDLVKRGHRQLYREKGNVFWGAVGFVTRDFPAALRRQAPAFWAAFFLFYGPALLMGVTTWTNPAFIHSVMDEAQVMRLETMYGPAAKKPGRPLQRDAETDLTMFGFYIYNNISIGFKTFAGGVVFGLGTLFFLLFNGVFLGAVAGYLSHPPYQSHFWQFVPGHGAFELTAIVISGAAGLMLGMSLIRPGANTRMDAFRLKAPEALRLVMGAAFLLLVAAFFEAFWSSSAMPAGVKYAVAAFNWLFVTLYLLFAGKGAHGP